jgi:hypothetical protein
MTATELRLSAAGGWKLGVRPPRAVCYSIDDRGWSIYGAERTQPTAIAGKGPGRETPQVLANRCQRLSPVATTSAW